MSKATIQNGIVKLVEQAEKEGIKICVGSDPEGNGYHYLDTKYMLYGDTKPKAIVLGVMGGIDEEEIFDLDELNKEILN